MPKGMVKWYDRKKGYGFIQAEDGEDIFVHMSSIKCDGIKSLYEGEKVTFELGIGKKGPAAVSNLSLYSRTRYDNSYFRKLS